MFLKLRTGSTVVVMVAALLFAGCGPDRRRDQCIAGHPNFVVLITAPSRQTLPSDLMVTAHYGGAGVVTYHMNQTAAQQVLFCNPAALDGGMLLAGDAGDAGDAGKPTDVEALRCELWTGGPAVLDIDAATYAHTTRELTPLASSCPLDVMISLSEKDAG